MSGVAALAVAFIIVTGGAVRITGSGLGCPDWPTCSKNRLVAELRDPPAMVEFSNRVITALVSIAVIVCVLGALYRKPQRRDLTWLSLGLVGGVLAQIVLGGLTVLFHLNPLLVMSHFLLSMVILTDGVILFHRAGRPDGAPSRPVVEPAEQWMGRLVVAAAGLAVILGTVVTGSGPHGGDPDVTRLPFLVPDVARLHGSAVILFLLVTIVTLWRVRAAGAPAQLMRAGEILVGVAAAQAAIGYVQYFTGVPVVLVGFHIAGAASVWAAAVWFMLAFSVHPDPSGYGGA